MTDTGETVHGTLPPRPARRRPPRSRYWLAGLVAVAGIVVALAYSIAAQAVLSNHADGFVRASIPGEITLHVDHAATYYVFAEGARWFHPSVQVTDPEGHAVAVGATSPGPSYYHGGNGGSAVGTFRAVQPGDYKVGVSTGASVQGDFAVGGSFPMWMRLSDWEAWALLVLFAGSSLVLVIRTAIQRRRPEAA
jgi:hypothetical protein